LGNNDLRELAIACRDGDRRSFETLVHSESRALIALAFRYTGDWEVARDLTQDTWMRVHERIHRWDPARSFRAWLLAVHRNGCLDHLRRAWVRYEATPGEEAIERLRLVSGDGNPEEELVRREFHERLLAALGELSESQRQVFVRVDLEQNNHYTTSMYGGSAVKKGIDCDVFHDQLDALKEGSLSEEGLEQLRLHADACSECAMSLKLHEHLASALTNLEAAVPDELVASVWPGVEAEVNVKRSEHPGDRSVRRGRSWLVPTLAAATLLLGVATGLLYKELTRVQARERVLAQTVTAQQSWLAELDQRTSANATALEAGLSGPGWARALPRREQMTIAELSDLLRRMPARATVLTTSQAETLLGAIPVWTPPGWRNAIGEIDIRDGVRAGELVEILDTLGVDPEMTLRTSRVLDLFRG
jgi:RNA polymerase sigma factor (sigma-70 family)